MMSTLKEPPRFGSVRETALIMFTLMKERSDHARLRSIVQSIVDKEKGVEAFEEYMKTAFPWIESSKGKDRMDHMKRLMSEINRGPLAVVPMAMTSAKSRLRERIEKKEAPRDPAAMNRVLDKLAKRAPR